MYMYYNNQNISSNINFTEHYFKVLHNYSMILHALVKNGWSQFENTDAQDTVRQYNKVDQFTT